MTAAAIVLVLATLLIHYSHCKAEATFAHLEVSTRTIMKFVVKRQDAIGNCTAERVAQFFWKLATSLPVWGEHRHHVCNCDPEPDWNQCGLQDNLPAEMW